MEAIKDLWPVFVLLGLMVTAMVGKHYLRYKGRW